MKSLLFKSAWSIFRMENISFSESLKKAWKCIKDGKKAIVVKSNKVVKSIGLGFEIIYFNELVYTSIEVLKFKTNNSGASLYYDGKTFNND
jgi:hypothetical protein